MLLGSSGPANGRYLSVGTTSALIKLCAQVSPWQVSSSRLRSCRNILRCSGTDHRSWFPTCCPTQVSHAEMSGGCWSISLMLFPCDDSRQRARHDYPSWWPTGSFDVCAGRLLSAITLYFHHCRLRDDSSRGLRPVILEICPTCLYKFSFPMYPRLVSTMVVAARSSGIPIR